MLDKSLDLIKKEAEKDNISEACILYITKNNEALKLWWITDDYNEIASRMTSLLMSLILEIDRAHSSWMEEVEIDDEDE